MGFLLYGRTFATQAFLGTLLIFSPPFLQVLDLAHDPDVNYWCGSKVLKFTVLMPAFFLLVYLAHSETKSPRRDGLIVSFLFPSLFYFFVGFWLLFLSNNLADQVHSAECGDTVAALNMSPMCSLQRAWKDAAEFHGKCVRDARVRTLGVGQCDAYALEIAAVPGRREQWEYLEHLERSSGCAGWVEHGPHLWVQDWGDWTTCAEVVAATLRGKLNYSAYQLMVYSVIALVVGLGWVAKMTPLFRMQQRHVVKDHLYWYAPGSR